MEKVLNGPWSWSFYITSLIARLPLSVLPVIILLGTLDKGIAGAGATLAAVAIGAAIAGIIQGPLWDRLPPASFMFGLSFMAAILLVIFSFLSEGILALFVIALYGFFRPQMSTVTRSVWMQRFSDSNYLSSKSISLDIASIPVIGVIGPLLAGVSFAALGYKASLIGLAVLAFLAALFMLFLIKINQGEEKQKTQESMFDSIRTFFTHPPLLTILVLAVFSASASGVVTILLSANLESRGMLDLLSPMLALSAAAVIVGAYFFKRFVETPGGYLHIFLLIESVGLFLYAIGFVSGIPVLWIVVFLGGLAAAPLGTILYILIEQRSRDGDRSAAFSLLATSQFLGVSLGQFIFSRIAEGSSVEWAMIIAASIQLLCFFAWISLPYGMKRYRLQKTFSWWPEDLEEIIKPDKKEGKALIKDGAFAQIRPYLKNELLRGSVPDLPRHFRSEKIKEQDPMIVGISKIAWDEAWQAERPTVKSALECGEWLSRNSFSEEQIEEIALYLGFEHRDFIEEGDLARDWTGYSDRAILFASIFKAASLRGSRMYLKMINWLKSPVLRHTEKNDLNQLLILLAKTALGEGLDQEKYEKLWQENYQEKRMACLFILLDTLNLSLNQPGHPLLLVEKSNKYIEMNKDYGRHIAWAFKARGERFLGRLEEARDSILMAYHYLPFSENHRSNVLFVEQFDAERMAIDQLLNEKNRKIKGS